MKGLILFSVAVLFLIGCSVEYYPTTVNVPLQKEEGDIEASVITGNNGYDVQVAYAPINHLGFMVTGSYKDKSTEDGLGNIDDFHKHLFGEFGAGYFNKLSEKAVVEVFAGGGYGSMEGNYSSDIWTGDYDKVEYGKLFLQPQIGMANDVFEFAFATRLSGINVWYLGSDTSSFGLFLEPVVSFKVGYKYVKFTTQVGFSWPLNDDFNFDYSPFIVGAGLNFSFGKSYLRKK